METKITSVIQLARYKMGDRLFWVTFRPIAQSEIRIGPDDGWLQDAHPKTFFERKFIKNVWGGRIMPRLCSLDFQCVTDILTTEPIVEDFRIKRIVRSPDTGEFYYGNQNNEWMPESSLFETASAARREKKRIKQMFAEWASKTSPDDIEDES